MKGPSKWVRAMHGFVAGVALAVVLAGPAAAYVGPGAGVTAIGAVVAVIATLVLAVVGFIWYPVKRLLHKHRRASGPRHRERAAHAGSDD